MNEREQLARDAFIAFCANPAIAFPKLEQTAELAFEAADAFLDQLAHQRKLEHAAERAVELKARRSEARRDMAQLRKDNA